MVQQPLHLSNKCLLNQRPDGKWECPRFRCGYVTVKAYDVAPTRYGCKGIGPGSILTYVLAAIGITEESWLRFIRKYRPGVICTGCRKRAEMADRSFFAIWRWKPFEKWRANYAANIRWLKSLLAANHCPIK